MPRCTLPDADGVLFTGRLSLATHPWLADHAVMGTVLLPGTAFVELAVRAGDQVGCDLLEELTLEAPLVLPEHGGVQLQVTVGERRTRTAAGTGRALPARGRARRGVDPHAPAASLAAATRCAGRRLRRSVWPPAGAESVAGGRVLRGLVAAGFGYGPVFQGLRAAWRRGDEVFAEVALPEDAAAEAARSALHPALLDAALHTVGLARRRRHGAAVRLDRGAPARRRRDRAAGAALRRPGTAGCRSWSADETGAPVATIDSLVTRPVPAEQLGTHRRGAAIAVPSWAGRRSAMPPTPVPALDRGGRRTPSGSSNPCGRPGCGRRHLRRTGEGRGPGPGTGRGAC